MSAYFCTKQEVMKVYYYHTIGAQVVFSKWQQGLLPAHLLYGAIHLRDLGMDVTFHQAMKTNSRWRLSLDTAWKVWRRRKSIDVVYATTFRGLELIVFLRALHLFHKPIVCWHHQPIVKAKNPFRELVARLFYKGFDELLFFSEKIVEDSKRSVKANPAHMHIVHWGADLPFYDQLVAAMPRNIPHCGFVSTGKERRDMPTLVAAFNKTQEPLDIYICRETNGFSYEHLFTQLAVNSNIQVHFIQGDVFLAMAKKVYASQCAVICCQETNYTVGLTTVVEALALGIPMICSRNPQMPMDLEQEKCGILVDYGDVEGWKRAIEYISSHPEEAVAMGRRGRALAERLYNERQCGEEVAKILRALF